MENMPKSLGLFIIYRGAAADIFVCGFVYILKLVALQGNNENCWVKEHNVLNFNRGLSISYCCCNKLQGTCALKQYKFTILEFC